MPNRLQHETSPYLLQHAENPVDWYPWGPEAFEAARAQDKPIFLSIGYSACHWCHVMARESFEDPEIAALLNRYFISVKVDREERPDIDSVYLTVCQAFTGSGGWPASIFMTADQKPFFAGTYFPRHSRGGMAGFEELLQLVQLQWENNRPDLLSRGGRILEELKRRRPEAGQARPDLLDRAAEDYRRIYDAADGGFGSAPKFPAAHNLLFLLARSRRQGDESCLQMAEHTLTQMYRGGLFDQIGFGFCRYSTDQKFLVPHFEKMLYDNALLILAYSRAYEIAQKERYLTAARRTADFLLREMQSPPGGFYSAQDADSQGEEGKYYLFSPEEIIRVLGEKRGAAFNCRFDIRPGGNFQGKSIPNLLRSDPDGEPMEDCLDLLYRYRKGRFPLAIDDKILTAWNALAVGALSRLYQVGGGRRYLEGARRADRFIWENLQEKGRLFASFRAGRRGAEAFLDDYAACQFAQLALYDATLEEGYLNRAEALCGQMEDEFLDKERGGFFLYGNRSPRLILRPKETYDGAAPSGNGLAAWNLARLSQLTGKERHIRLARRQLDFLAAEAGRYPIGSAMFLLALLEETAPPPRLTVVLAEGENPPNLPPALPTDVAVRLLKAPQAEYPLKDGKTTFYLCRDGACLPPSNDLETLWE